MVEQPANTYPEVAMDWVLGEINRISEKSSPQLPKPCSTDLDIQHAQQANNKIEQNKNPAFRSLSKKSSREKNHPLPGNGQSVLSSTQLVTSWWPPVNMEQVAFQWPPRHSQGVCLSEATQRTDSEVKVMRRASGIAPICRGKLLLLVDSFVLQGKRLREKRVNI